MVNLFLQKAKRRKSLILIFSLATALALTLNSCDEDEEPATPEITNVDPAGAPENTPITITGKNFASDAIVKFGTVAAAVTSATATQIVTRVPEGLALGATEVMVTVGSKTSAAYNFEVIAEPVPIISSIAPDSARLGVAVTITGTDFEAGAVVKFGTATAAVTSITPTQIVTRVPNAVSIGATAVTVTVEDRVSNATAFVVMADPPVISNFDPKEGAPGTEITITGENFSNTDAENVVMFGGHRADLVSATTTTIKVNVPDIEEGGVALKVTVNGQNVTATETFKVTPKNPVRDLYWAQVSTSGAWEIVKGYRNSEQQLVVQKLYDIEPGWELSSNTLALNMTANEIYWAAGILNFETFLVDVKVFKGSTSGETATEIFTPEEEIRGLALDANAGKLYWTGISNTTSEAGVWKANLDGTGKVKLYSSESLQIPSAITVNPVNGDIYFVEDHDHAVDPPTSKVFKGNAAGDAKVEIFSEASLPDLNGNFKSITTDGSKLFIANQYAAAGAVSKIYSGSVTGGTLNMLYQSIPINPDDPLEVINSITIDTQTSLLYWLNRGRTEGTSGGVSTYTDGTIYRAPTAPTGETVPERLFTDLKFTSSSTMQ